jgi:hypothetical protein
VQLCSYATRGWSRRCCVNAHFQRSPGVTRVLQGDRRLRYFDDDLPPTRYHIDTFRQTVATTETKKRSKRERLKAPGAGRSNRESAFMPELRCSADPLSYALLLALLCILPATGFTTTILSPLSFTSSLPNSLYHLPSISRPSRTPVPICARRPSEKLPPDEDLLNGRGGGGGGWGGSVKPPMPGAWMEDTV